jgi:hypothetical protein
MKISSTELKILERLHNYFIIHNIKYLFSQSKESDNSGGQKLNPEGVRLTKY